MDSSFAVSGDASTESSESAVSTDSALSSEIETQLSSDTGANQSGPDLSGWVIHVAYIGGMIICLLLGCMLGYYIRGRKES